jgi:hypothetical protein
VKQQGAWVGLAVGVFGLAMSVVALARGGGYFLVVSRLTFVLPLAVVGTVTALVAAGVGRKSLNAVMWLGVVAVAGWGWNFLAQWLRWGSAVWGILLPLARPTGLDFRDGLYDPARSFSTARSGWPPLTLLLGRPFTLVSFSTGYAIQVCILVALAIAAAVLSAKLAAKAVCVPDASGQGRKVDGTTIAVVMGFWLMTSYGFMFEVERGNIDLYALVFSLASVWLMIRFPKSAWLPAAALAVAIGLKLYPAVLLVVLVWRYRWRALVPAVATIVAVMAVGGLANLHHSLTALSSIQAAPVRLGWLNESAAALAHQLRHDTSWAPSWILYPLLLVPLTLWGSTLLLLIGRGCSDRRIVLAAAACVPVMVVVPTISNDYKLVLSVFPLAVLAAVVATMRREPRMAWIALFGALAFTMVFLAGSSHVVAPSLQTSKYAFQVVLQALLLAVVLLADRRPPQPAPASASMPGKSELARR